MNQTAAVFKVHISTVIRWVEQYKKTGDVKNKIRKPVNKKEALYAIIANTSHTLLFLPPYSPDLNPIEHYWSALKRNLAAQAHRYHSVAQTLDSLLIVN